jgi:hypothetical protein
MTIVVSISLSGIVFPLPGMTAEHVPQDSPVLNIYASRSKVRLNFTADGEIQGE